MSDRSEPEDSPDDGPPPLDLTTLVYALARSRWWIVGGVTLGGLVGLYAGAREINTYTSEAKLLLLVGERESLKPESLVSVSGVNMPSAQSLPTVSDEIQMLYDMSVFKQAALAIGPERILVPPEPTATDGPDTPWAARLVHMIQAKLAPEKFEFSDYTSPPAVLAAARSLYRNTRISAGPNSHVLWVEHTAATPTRAQEFTSALVEAFIDRHQAQYSILPFLAEHGDEIAAARDQRDDAIQAYLSHMEQCGFVALETQGPALIAEQDSINEALFDARVELDGIGVERAELITRLESIPPEIEDVDVAVTVPSLEYETHFSLLTDLLAERQILGIQDLPLEQVRRREKEYDKEIERVRGVLAGLEPLVVLQPEKRTPVPNPDHVALKLRIDDLRVRGMVLERLVSQLEERLEEELRPKLDQLRKCEHVHEELLAVRDEKKTRFAELFEHYSKLEALGNFDVEGEANLRVLNEATFNPDKVGPNRAKLLLMGLFGGGAMGVALALARLLLDPRLRYPQTVAGLLRPRLLGVVPHERALHGIAGRS